MRAAVGLPKYQAPPRGICRANAVVVDDASVCRCCVTGCRGRKAVAGQPGVAADTLCVRDNSATIMPKERRTLEVAMDLIVCIR